jgi:hypothetical protein
MSNNAGILPRWRPPSVPKLTNKAVDRVRNQFGGLNLRPERIHSQRLGRAHESKLNTGERASKRHRHPCPVVLGIIRLGCQPLARSEVSRFDFKSVPKQGSSSPAQFFQASRSSRSRRENSTKPQPRPDVKYYLSRRANETDP